jgi:hypothetical protein
VEVGRWLSDALYATSSRFSATPNVSKEEQSVHYTMKIRVDTQVDRDASSNSGWIHSWEERKEKNMQISLQTDKYCVCIAQNDLVNYVSLFICLLHSVWFPTLLRRIQKYVNKVLRLWMSEWITTDGQSVSLSWCRAPDINYYLTVTVFFDVGSPLWREVGSVICPSYLNCFSTVQ